MFSILIRLFFALTVAFLAGKLMVKLKLPGILGWLLTGMILGPFVLAIVEQEVRTTQWYTSCIHIVETTNGIMLGVELVWRKLRKTGKSVIITTCVQGFFTFFLVTLAFGVLFYFMHVPFYLAFLLGSIALGTAAAPAISIARTFRSRGPVTEALIPTTALDTVLASLVFSSAVAVVTGILSAGELSNFVLAMIVVMPIVGGTAVGILTGLVLKRKLPLWVRIVVLVLGTLGTTAVGLWSNAEIMGKPLMNFTLMGMAFSAAFSNMMSQEDLEKMIKTYDPALTFAIIAVILNLGFGLDYRMILGAGVFTAVYIIVRAAGKYLGTYIGAGLSGAPKVVQKYLGCTLLPHSGICLVFLGIVLPVVLPADPASARILQATVASAAIINELISVVISGQSLKLAGETDKAD